MPDTPSKRVLKRKHTPDADVVSLETHQCLRVGEQLLPIPTSSVEGVDKVALLKASTPWLLELGFGAKRKHTDNVAAIRL